MSDEAAKALAYEVRLVAASVGFGLWWIGFAVLIS
jgi:hypothetical protein